MVAFLCATPRSCYLETPLPLSQSPYGRAIVVLPLDKLFGVLEDFDCFSVSKGKRNFRKGLTYLCNVASEPLDINLFRSSEQIFPLDVRKNDRAVQSVKRKVRSNGVLRLKLQQYKLKG